MMGRAILPHFLLLSSSPPQLSSSLYYLHLYLNSPILYAVHILIQSQARHSLDFQANISKLGANSSKCKMRDALLVSVATPLSHSRSLLLQRVLRALRTWNLTQRPECNNLLSVYQLISRKTRAYVDRVLEGGTTKAAELADATLNNVYLAMGFLRRL